MTSKFLTMCREIDVGGRKNLSEDKTKMASGRDLELQSAVDKYKDGSIPKVGKIELIKKFRQDFNLKSNYSFSTVLRRELEESTPDRRRWLIDNINEYWEFYNK